MKIKEIQMKITLVDGSTSKAWIEADAEWSQSGASKERLSQTTEAVESMAQAPR